MFPREVQSEEAGSSYRWYCRLCARHPNWSTCRTCRFWRKVQVVIPVLVTWPSETQRFFFGGLPVAHGLVDIFGWWSSTTHDHQFILIFTVGFKPVNLKTQTPFQVTRGAIFFSRSKKKKTTLAGRLHPPLQVPGTGVVLLPLLLLSITNKKS